MVEIRPIVMVRGRRKVDKELFDSEEEEWIGR
jgi:hypothetical protein